MEFPRFCLDCNYYFLLISPELIRVVQLESILWALCHAIGPVGIMSVNDRASYMNAPRPRVVSNRVEAGPRGASPLPDHMDALRSSTASQKHRMSRDQRSMSEKRTERTTITTREKSVRRNPIKESSSAANRGDRDKSRPKYPSQLDGASPGGPIREKDAVES